MLVHDFNHRAIATDIINKMDEIIKHRQKKAIFHHYISEKISLDEYDKLK